MYDIVFISNNEGNSDAKYRKLKSKFPLVKRASSMVAAQKKSVTKMVWIVYADVVVLDTFDFTYKVPVWDEQYVHVFKNDDFYDGICLVHKLKNLSQREIDNRFYLAVKEVDIIASSRLYDQFYIDTYEEYLIATEASSTELFWMIPRNVEIDKDFKFDLYFGHHNLHDRSCNHSFAHLEDNEKTYDGVFLCSKLSLLSKKEINYRFPINRKEWDIVASGPKLYDQFYIDTYEEYLIAVDTSSTELFWMIPRNVEIDKDFKFDLYFSCKSDRYEHDRCCNHAFIHIEANIETYDGVFLCSKHSLLSKKEVYYRFPIERKEWDIVASHPVRYDIVFISYFEKSADENYQRVNEKFGNVYRVDGVSGIHQAHIAAAKCVSTDMFWVVDADAIIEDDFSFNYQIPKYDDYQKKTVHVWRSKNPINGLIYGYGGVKLLPTQLTLFMDIEQPDMTTSIAPSFKVHHEVSNTTSFNTDEFSSWKSAYRECVKLSSKVIIGQDTTETDDRLDTWCTVGSETPYGEYAIAGAIAGKEYGQKNAGNIPALYKINDFDWLLNQFNLI